MAGKKVKTEPIAGYGYISDLDDFSPTVLLPPDSYSTYYEMFSTDTQVRQGIEAIKKTILSGEWFIENVESEVGTFIHNNLFNNINFPRILNSVLDFIVYGVYFIEPVFDYDKENKRVILKKLIPRHPASIVRFIFNDEEPYNITHIEFYSKYGTFIMPVEELIIFSFSENFYDSQSLLRAAYKHWMIKNKLYRMANLAVARKGVGIPIAALKTPGKLSENQKNSITGVMQALQTSDAGYIIKPPWLDLEEFGGNRDPVTFLDYINHHNKEILKATLTSFLSLGIDVAGGTYNLSRDTSKLFYSAARYIAKIVADTFNRYLISNLIFLNFDKVEGELPKLNVTQVGRDVTVDDVKALSYAMQAGLITPDPAVENTVRKWYNLPTIKKPKKETMPSPEEQEKASEVLQFREDPDIMRGLLIDKYIEIFKRKYIETAKKYGRVVEEINFDEEKIKRKVARMLEEGDLDDEESAAWMVAIISSQAEGEAEAQFFADYDYEIVSFEGVDDEKTCPLCSFLHGKYFLLSEIQKLGLIPPLHHNCRDHLKGFKLEEIPENEIFRLSEIPPDLVRYHTLKY